MGTSKRFNSILSIINTDDIITYANRAFCELSEYTEEEILGKDYHDIMTFVQETSLREIIHHRLKVEKKIWRGVIKNTSRSGKPYYLDSTIKPILDENGDLVEYVALRHDVTAILNPYKQLDDLIESAKVPILILIKIEGFEDIKNFYSQKDLHLIEEKIAQSLFELFPRELSFDTIFSLKNGTYAFAKDKYECNVDEESLIKLLKVFQNMVQESHVSVGELDYDLSIIMSLSYGEAVFENARYGLEELEKSTQSFIVATDFVKQKHQKAEQNIKILKMVKTAIEEHKIISYFQPIVNNKTREIEKYESLVRLVDSEGNIISPYVFLNTAKKGKYYNQITSMVLDNSFEVLTKIGTDISINISSLDIEKEATREKIFYLLEEYKEFSHRVVLELLEDEEVKDFAVISDFIRKVKALGVKIAIDDFGSGYSNFSRLLEYQPDILKIDGSLVKDILTDSFALSIVKTMIKFAREQNLQIIAEYVENKEIYELLCELGVDYSQGYYFGKPEPLK